MFFADYRRRRFQRKVEHAMKMVIYRHAPTPYQGIEDISTRLSEGCDVDEYFAYIGKLAKWVEAYAVRAPLIEVTCTEKTPDVFCCSKKTKSREKK